MPRPPVGFVEGCCQGRHFVEEWRRVRRIGRTRSNWDVCVFRVTSCLTTLLPLGKANRSPIELIEVAPPRVAGVVLLSLSYCWKLKAFGRRWEFTCRLSPVVRIGHFEGCDCQFMVEWCWPLRLVEAAVRAVEASPLFRNGIYVVPEAIRLHAERCRLFRVTSCLENQLLLGKANRHKSFELMELFQSMWFIFLATSYCKFYADPFLNLLFWLWFQDSSIIGLKLSTILK